MKLPGPCPECALFGGSWTETETGLKRCSCPRGLALIEVAKVPQPRDPVISPEYAIVCTEIMATMAFFPSEAGARAAIADEIAAMCSSEEDARWLARRITRLHRKWPGLQELRLVFCDKYRPLDGLPAFGSSELYPEGFPSEYPLAPEPKRLNGKPQPGEISGAPSVEATVRDLAELKNLNRIGPAPRVRDIPLRQLTDADRITPEMIAAAVLKSREERARQELGLETEDAERPGSTEGV